MWLKDKRKDKVVQKAHNGIISIFRTFRHHCNLLQQQQQQPFNGLFSRITWVSRYQKGKTNLDFTGAVRQ